MSRADESACSVKEGGQQATSRPSSGLIRALPVLPPISTPDHGTAHINDTNVSQVSASTREEKPVVASSVPSNARATRPAVTDENIEQVLTEKRDLIKHVMEAPDLKENPQKYLNSCRDLSYGTTHAVTASFNNLQRIHEVFLEMSFFDFLAKYWRSLKVESNNAWDLSLANKTEYYQLDIFSCLVSPVWNGTDTADPKYCSLFNETLRPLFLDILGTTTFYDFVKSDLQNRAIKGLLASLYNLVRTFPDGNKAVRESQGVSTISRYVLHTNVQIKTIATITLSFIINEDERDRLKSADDQIKYLIAVLSTSLKNPQWNCRSKYQGFSSEEVLDSLNHMAQVDSIKAAIVRCGALPLYARLLKSDCSAAQQATACKGLWILAFNEENKRKIYFETGCMDDLRSLCLSTDEQVKKSAEGALWAIEGEQKRMKHATDTAADEKTMYVAGGHIMISYNWGVKQHVIKIKDRMKARGYKVWIDVEQMSGSTLDSMASAIDEASLVIIVFTEQYKLSPSCRSEAEYCYKRQKPFIPVRLQPKYLADGWLGMILGTRLFYDLTRDDAWESTFENLCAEINKIMGHQVGSSAISPGGQRKTATDGLEVRRTDASIFATQLDLHSEKVGQDFVAMTWNEADVQKWLCSNGLEKCTDSLLGFSGLQVVELRHALTSAPTYYYSALQQSLGMSIKDAMTFTKILRELP